MSETKIRAKVEYDSTILNYFSSSKVKNTYWNNIATGKNKERKKG